MILDLAVVGGVQHDRRTPALPRDRTKSPRLVDIIATSSAVITARTIAHLEQLRHEVLATNRLDLRNQHCREGCPKSQGGIRQMAPAAPGMGLTLTKQLVVKQTKAFHVLSSKLSRPAYGSPSSAMRAPALIRAQQFWTCAGKALLLSPNQDASEGGT